MDNHDVAPVSNNWIEFGLIQQSSVTKCDSVGVSIFERDVVATSFEIGAKRSASGDNFGSVGGLAEAAR